MERQGLCDIAFGKVTWQHLSKSKIQPQSHFFTIQTLGYISMYAYISLYASLSSCHSLENRLEGYIATVSIWGAAFCHSPVSRYQAYVHINTNARICSIFFLMTEKRMFATNFIIRKDTSRMHYKWVHEIKTCSWTVPGWLSQ